MRPNSMRHLGLGLDHPAASNSRHAPVELILRVQRKHAAAKPPAHIAELHGAQVQQRRQARRARRREARNRVAQMGS